MADTAESSERENLLAKLTEIHVPFAFTIVLLLTLVGLQYLGTGRTPLVEQRIKMYGFIMIVLGYAIILVKMTLNNHDPHHRNSNSIPSTQATSTSTTSHTHAAYTYIFLISGTLACELLLLVLVPPLWFLIINGFASIFHMVLHYSDRLQIGWSALMARAPTAASTTSTSIEPEGHVQLSNIVVDAVNSRSNTTH